jgi:hypothetical protein
MAGGLAQVAGEPPGKAGGIQPRRSVPRERRERLAKRAGGLHRGQAPGGNRQVARSDGDLDTLRAQFRLERCRNGEQPRTAAGVEQPEAPGCHLTGQHVGRDPAQHGTDGVGLEKVGALFDLTSRRPMSLAVPARSRASVARANACGVAMVCDSIGAGGRAKVR